MSEYEFEVWQDGVPVAMANAANREDALREARHYMAQYRQDGPVELREVIRRSVSDGNPEGENPKGSSAEGMTARCHEVADARLSSSKARIETLETALEEIASDVGFLLRAIEDQDPYGELRLRVRDITKLVRDLRSALRPKGETEDGQ